MTFTYNITTNGNLEVTGNTIKGKIGGNGLVTVTSSDGFVKDFEVTVIDTLSPNEPTNLLIDNTGLILTGKAEIDSTVKSYTSGNVLLKTATANSNGDFTMTFDTAFLNGETIKVNATDTNNNVSAFANVIAPDTTAPNEPTANFDETGGIITGTTEKNAVIKIKSDIDVLIKQGTADIIGDYAITLDTPFTNGETIHVTSTDTNNNESGNTVITAPVI